MATPKGTSSASATPSRAAGFGFYGHHVRPGFTNVVLGTRDFGRLRARIAAGLDGEVRDSRPPRLQPHGN